MTIEPDLSVKEVACILRVAPEKVRRWIRAGEMGGTNTSNGTRPIYMIPREALEEFRRRRAGVVKTDDDTQLHDLPEVEEIVR